MIIFNFTILGYNFNFFYCLKRETCLIRFTWMIIMMIIFEQKYHKYDKQSHKKRVLQIIKFNIRCLNIFSYSLDYLLM